MTTKFWFAACSLAVALGLGGCVADQAEESEPTDEATASLELGDSDPGTGSATGDNAGDGEDAAASGVDGSADPKAGGDRIEPEPEPWRGKGPPVTRSNYQPDPDSHDHFNAI